MQNDVLFYQRFLKSNGFYADVLDGDWGPNTDAADDAFHRKSEAIANREGRFDTSSERNILTLAPVAQIAARRFLALLKGRVPEARIISGTRTYQEQDVIYAQGRTTPGNIVTNAKGGQSNHNFGIAWDIGLFNGGQYIRDDIEPYQDLATQVMHHMSAQLQWGGNWTTFKDWPHYQLKATSPDLSVVRNHFESGTPYV